MIITPLDNNNTRDRGFQRQTTDEDYFFGQNLLPLDHSASRPAAIR